jgi:hypothetical protein
MGMPGGAVAVGIALIEEIGCLGCSAGVGKSVRGIVGNRGTAGIHFEGIEHSGACDLTSFDGGCPMPVDLTQESMLNLNIENLFTPPPVEENSIGFEKLLDYPNPAGATLPGIYTLKGSMNIRLTNVFVLGQAATNGKDVNVDYDFIPGDLFGFGFPGQP